MELHDFDMGAEPLQLDVIVTRFKRMLDCEMLSVCRSIVLDVLKSGFRYKLHGK